MFNIKEFLVNNPGRVIESEKPWDWSSDININDIISDIIDGMAKLDSTPRYIYVHPETYSLLVGLSIFDEGNFEKLMQLGNAFYFTGDSKRAINYILSDENRASKDYAIILGYGHNCAIHISSDKGKNTPIDDKVTEQPSHNDPNSIFNRVGTIFDD